MKSNPPLPLRQFLSACLLLASSLLMLAAEGMSIALISDSHTTRDTKPPLPLYRPRLEKAIADINAAKVDLVLVAGDLTESGKPEEFADFKEQIKGFKAPIWYVPGNHDVGAKVVPDAKRPGITAQLMAAYENTMGPSFWIREQGLVRVIGVNGPLFGSKLPPEEKQWAMLETACAKPPAKASILLIHYPPYSKTPDEPGGGYWNLEPEPRARLLGLLKKGEIKTVLSGHLHRGLTNQLEGITFLTTTTVAAGDPKKNPNRGWILLTVSAKGEINYELRPLKD